MSLDDDDALEPPTDASFDDDDALLDATDTRPAVTAADVKRFLALPATLARATRLIGRRVAAQDAEDLVSDAVERALRATKLPSREGMQAWFDRICQRVPAGHHRKRARRRKYEGDMPVAPVKTDEAGLPLADEGDAVIDIDPRYDPEGDGFQAEGGLLRDWLDRHVEDRPRDRETYAMMKEWADEGRTYEQIAADRGMTIAEVTSRVFAFKKKYRPRFVRYRNRTVALLVLLLLGIAAIVWWLLLRSPRVETIEPARDLPWPPPSASAPPAPPPSRMNQALPPTIPTGPK